MLTGKNIRGVARLMNQTTESSPAAPILPAAGAEIEVRSLDKVMAEIRRTFARKGVVGVMGFSITVKTENSCAQLKWGNGRVRRFRTTPRVVHVDA